MEGLIILVVVIVLFLLQWQLFAALLEVRMERISNTIRDIPPCRDCTEKFEACHGRCPKDARGEFGYAAWKKEVDRVNREREKYAKLPRIKFR